MVADPGVEEKDERPHKKSADDSVLTQAFARETELEDDRDGEIEKEEAEVGSVAIEVVGDGEPHGDPGEDLTQDETPSPSQVPGSGEDERADDANKKTAGDKDMEDSLAANIETVGGEDGGEGCGVDEDVQKSGGAGVQIPARGPEEDGSGSKVGIECDGVRGDVPGAVGNVEGMGYRLNEDAEEADEP